MCLVQRDFKHPRIDLSAADQTLCRRKNDRQIFGLNPTVLCDCGNNRFWRRPRTFNDQGAARGVVGIAQVLE